MSILIKSDLIKIDKEIAGNLNYNMIGDTNNVNSTYESMMNKVLGYTPKVLNCSPDSLYTCFERINYNQILGWLNENTFSRL